VIQGLEFGWDGRRAGNSPTPYASPAAFATVLRQVLRPQFIQCSTLRCEGWGFKGQLPVTILEVMTLLPLLIGLSPSGFAVRSIVVEDRIIMRVPVRPTPPVEWVERKGPRCIPARAIRGASVSGNQHVDFMLSGHRLLRAELEDNCPALDFYEGFYLSSEDEKVCAKRDSVRSRIGAACSIRRFRELKPRRL
jgi:hypothetical protein